MPGLTQQLEERLAPAFAAVAGTDVDPVIRRSRHTDFQADGALGLARRLRENPRAIAERIVERADLDDLCSEVAVSGPGFINLTLSAGALGRMLAAISHDERLGVPVTDHPETVVIDYSAPNAAKEMHVGHLRSTIIGDAAVRLLEWVGHTVVRENHIGDWGTPFGMLIEHLLDIGEAEAAHKLSVGDLNGFYRAARRKFEADQVFQERSRQRVVLLQRGDPATLRLWHTLVEESQAYFLAVYDRLGVRLTADDFVGESVYNDQLQAIVDELDKLDLLRVNDAARCVFPGGFHNRNGEPLPLIVQKRDGGFGYAATDLATIRERIYDQGATRLLYVVGLPQRQHLEMVFATARDAGWLTPPARAEHVGHGAILGSDGKILRTRAGASIKLIDLLDEAVARAADVVAAKNPDMDDATRATVAEATGVGAVKYADLSTDRVKDYVFDYDRMLAFEGNTAPYLQYANARIRSIFRKLGRPASTDVAEVVVAAPEERALAIELLSLPGVIDEVVETMEFHRLATYLYGLATAFTGFYENCAVLRSEGRVRDSRLVLCDLTARTLALGLGLLGITAPEQM
ncbi:MAG TPA: arginine--tRNA ligase [Euzebyales bacterium]